MASGIENLIVMLHVVLAFFIAAIVTKYWIRIARRNDLVGKDMNKFNKPLVAEAGGIAVVVAIVSTTLLYIFFKTFILNSGAHFVELLALIITVLLACFIGFVDDILGWKKGLKGWKKILITIPIAIPFVVINAGESIMHVPFLGAVDFGLIYPLVIIPLGIMGAANGTNLLAGHNGLEAGLSIVVFIALGTIAIVTNQLWLVLLAGIIIFALFAFFLFNKFPAKIFPGRVLSPADRAFLLLKHFDSITPSARQKRALFITIYP